MSDLKQAVEQIRRYAPMLQAVIDIASAVDELSNIEQAIGEKKALLGSATDDLAGVKAKLDAANAKAAAIVADAQSQADGIKSVAEAYASDASAKAIAALDSAKSKSDKMLQSAKAAVESANEKTAESAAKVAADQQILADLQAKIDRARAKMAEILGT